MKPKTLTVYETTSGATVKTLAEWKALELEHLFGVPTDESAQAQRINQMQIVTRTLEESEKVIEILSVREKGRPLNRKDSKPRKPRVVADEGKAA